MNSSRVFGLGILICALTLGLAHAGEGENNTKGNSNSRLAIERDPVTGKVIITWKGHGVLKKAAGGTDGFVPVRHGRGEFVTDPTEAAALYRLEPQDNRSGPSNVYSVNIVGYVNVRLFPGLTLLATPLRQSNSSIASLFGGIHTYIPDGSQVFRYQDGAAYEVSTYDAVVRTWSNPNFDLSMGAGYFFHNPTSLTVTQTFVGEVLQGWLVNPLSAGLSTKGALVPQRGSVNTVHLIPGQPGEEIRTYVNDQAGGGYYNIATFSEETERWEPDLMLDVAEGFWIHKQSAQLWVRYFVVP